MFTNLTDGQCDLWLREALVRNIDEELDAIPPREELERMYTFSKRHAARMKKLFGQERRRERAKRALRRVRQAAAIFVVIAAVSFGILLLNPQVRAETADTVSMWFDGFMKFLSRAPEETAPESAGDEMAELRPRYLPDGFSEREAISFGDMTLITYADADGRRIIFLCMDAAGEKSVDNEHTTYSVNNIGGVDYHVFEGIVEGKTSTVIWDSAAMRFEISSELPASELLLVASSVGGYDGGSQ
jgi:hypothetical protein